MAENARSLLDETPLPSHLWINPENFKGWNDQNWCYRSRQLGLPTLSSNNSCSKPRTPFILYILGNCQDFSFHMVVPWLCGATSKPGVICPKAKVLPFCIFWCHSGKHFQVAADQTILMYCAARWRQCYWCQRASQYLMWKLMPTFPTDNGRWMILLMLG